MSSLQNAIILLLLVFIGVMLYLLYVKKTKTGDKLVQAPLPPPVQVPPQVIEKTVEVQPVFIEYPSYEYPYYYYNNPYPYYRGGYRGVRYIGGGHGFRPHPRPPMGGGIRPGGGVRPGGGSPRPGGRR